MYRISEMLSRRFTFRSQRTNRLRWQRRVAPALLLAALFGACAPSFGATIDRPLLVVSGDFDGDGLADKVQGFPDASDGAGRVDVFWGNPNFKVAWPTVLSAIKDPTTRLASGRLGESLAVGDFNGDRIDDLAIGAPHTNTARPIGSTAAARLSVYTHSGSVVVIYGCKAAPCGAIDSSGAGRAAVGSALDPSSGAGALRITASTGVDFGRFGKSVAVGDFDGDGYDDLAIGAPGDTVDAVPGAGSVTIIYGSSTGLDLATRKPIHQNLLPAGASRAEADDHFGWALSAARLNTDRYDDLVVGVPDEDYGVEVNAGELNVFWGGASRLSASNYVSFRHTSAMAGGSRSNDRLGYDVRTFNSVFALSGTLFAGLAEATSCGGRKGFLAVPAGGLGTADPVAVLNCDADILKPAGTPGGSTPGDGALPEIPVNFIVIANTATFGIGSDARKLPTAGWTGTDPITGGSISGESYFKSMVDLLNQQLRADDGMPVCDGNDCLRLSYRSHIYHSSSMFGNVCPKLHAIAKPKENMLNESPLAFTGNCEDTKSCPISSGQTRYENFSDFANAAVDECGMLADDDALNVIIYDLCDRATDPGGNDVLECAKAQNGRARVNGNHPYIFLDYARALSPRTPATTFPSAAEEHEAGHAFGLDHVCACPGAAGATPTMQTTDSGGCPSGTGPRNLGFGTRSRVDLDAPPKWVVEVKTMIQTAREHTKEWLRP